MVSLMEAYDEVSLDRGMNGASNELSDEIQQDLSPDENVEISKPTANLSELQDIQRESQKMLVAHLHTIRSHAHEIHSVIENGALIEPWMEEKIAIANDYIVNVANAIMYRK